MSVSKKSFFVLLTLFIFAETAFCQSGGLSGAKNLLENIEGALRALSVVTVTIAILWVGYKVLFGGQTLRECAPIIIGAILIAGASEIANLLISN
jgi:type IV secretion system protein VirB2